MRNLNPYSVSWRGVFGPVGAAALDAAKRMVETAPHRQERRNYPVSETIFPAAKRVSLISHDMTLFPGM
jgi:hypothetical protein